METFKGTVQLSGFVNSRDQKIRAGEQIAEARKRLAAALERRREIYDRLREKGGQGAKATDVAVRGHPYQVIGIAFSVGALIGDLVARRRVRDSEANEVVTILTDAVLRLAAFPVQRTAHELSQRT